MGELQFPPYSEELRRHSIEADRSLPLGLLQQMLWSEEHRMDRDELLGEIAGRWHWIEMPNGVVHQFTLLDQKPTELGGSEEIHEIALLDGFAEASANHAIGWNEEARRHVLIDPQLDGTPEAPGLFVLKEFLQKLARTEPAPYPIGELTQAMKVLTRAADLVRDAAYRVEAAYHLDITSSAVDAALEGPGGIDFLDRTLREAAALIDADVPVSPTGVKGYRWEPPLTLQKLLLYVDAAAETDPGYREAVRLNAAFAADRQQKIDVAQAQTCTACGRRPVYLPIDNAAADCYNHIAGDELERVERIWDHAIDALPCPGCTAAAGTMCTEDQDQLMLVNGRWPRIRKFRGRTVHKERLDLSAYTTATT